MSKAMFCVVFALVLVAYVQSLQFCQIFTFTQGLCDKKYAADIKKADSSMKCLYDNLPAHKEDMEKIVRCLAADGVKEIGEVLFEVCNNDPKGLAEVEKCFLSKTGLETMKEFSDAEFNPAMKKCTPDVTDPKCE